MEKTAWFPVGVRPVRKGRYEVLYWNSIVGKYYDEPEIQRFDGRCWRSADKFNNATAMGANRKDKWRGLTRPVAK